MGSVQKGNTDVLELHKHTKNSQSKKWQGLLKQIQRSDHVVASEDNRVITTGQKH